MSFLPVHQLCKHNFLFFSLFQFFEHHQWDRKRSKEELFERPLFGSLFLILIAFRCLQLRLYLLFFLIYLNEFGVRIENLVDGHLRECSCCCRRHRCRHCRCSTCRICPYFVSSFNFITFI